MNTKTIAVAIIFAALTIVLNLSPIKFPAPYAPFLIYQIWEVPIVAVFLLYGTAAGFLIALINTAVLIAVFPGALPTGPLYNFAAVLSMLLGIGVIKYLSDRHASKNEPLFASSLTISGAITRTVVMIILNYVLLRFPVPIGYSLPEETIIAYIPLVAIFNITLALYTIPIGYSLAKILKSQIRNLK